MTRKDGASGQDKSLPSTSGKTEIPPTTGKPREFWIAKSYISIDTDPPIERSTAYFEKQSRNDNYWHVIEKSAYDALQKENEELKVKAVTKQTDLIDMAKTVMVYGNERDKLSAELTSLREENEELKKEYANAYANGYGDQSIDLQRADAYGDQRDEEITSLREENEKLKANGNYDDLIIGSTGAKIKRRTINCLDCRKRVASYIESIKPFQDRIDSLCASLKLAVETLEHGSCGCQDELGIKCFGCIALAKIKGENK
jgi:hypothetical protein